MPITSRCCPNKKCFREELDQDTEPCWGHMGPAEEISTEDDVYWVHACEGHADCWDGGKYRPEPKAEE